MRFFFSLLFVAGASIASAQAPTHPLDGLSGAEHWIARDVLVAAGKWESTSRVPYLGLNEPPKAEIIAWRPGQPMRREARVHLVNGDKAFDAIVDLVGKRLVRFDPVPGVQWMHTPDEVTQVNQLLLAHPDFQAGLRRRGLTDPSLLTCFPIAQTYMGQPEEQNRRVVRAECWYIQGAVTGYGPPMTDLVGVIDLTANRVIRIIDHGAAPYGDDRGDWDTEAIGANRPALKPLIPSQPQGPSFSLVGSEVRWDQWSFRIRADMRRGLIISQAKFLDGSRERSVIYQGSLSELFVPYMAPEERWNYTAYFDLATFPGIFEGVMGSLEPGSDCPANAVMVDGLVAGWKGEPRRKPRVICLFERAAGDPVWRHGLQFGVADSRPRRDLVVRMVTHAGNYDYLFDWVFGQDGGIRVDVGATGIMQVKAAAPNDGRGTHDRYGRYVSANRVAINHSHFMSFRIDLDVDGANNSLVVERIKTERLPAANPRRSVWRAEGSVARVERDGQVMSTMAEPQLWRFVNPAIKGVGGDPVAYQIAVDHGAMSLMTPDDWMVKRASFINHMMWVTPYRPEELFAAGDYPTLSPVGAGLPAWTAANRPIENTDVVAWVTVGFHHVPRVEDWPVMPVAWHKFEIRPNGFFTRNPTLGLPKP
ncbi:MAG: hypothetical protein FJ206_04940 [Gemmatimonadetes bacterium]|nr:hypothetical protein [Gemmatimonadota bacterium]